MHLCKGSFYPVRRLGDKAVIVTTGIVPKYVCQLKELEGNVDVLLVMVLLPS